MQKTPKVQPFVLHVVLTTLTVCYVSYNFYYSTALIYAPIVALIILGIGIPVIQIRRLKSKIKFVVCALVESRYRYVKSEKIEDYDLAILKKINDSGMAINFKELLNGIGQNELYNDKTMLNEYIHENIRIKYYNLKNSAFAAQSVEKPEKSE